MVRQLRLWWRKRSYVAYLKRCKPWKTITPMSFEEWQLASFGYVLGDAQCAGCGEVKSECDCVFIQRAVEVFLAENPDIAARITPSDPKS